MNCNCSLGRKKYVLFKELLSFVIFCWKEISCYDCMVTIKTLLKYVMDKFFVIVCDGYLKRNFNVF